MSDENDRSKSPASESAQVASQSAQADWDMMNGLPVGWAFARIKAVADVVHPGFPYGQYNTVAKGYPHLRPMNIDGNGRLSLDEVKYVDIADPPLLQANDILFNNTNSPVWVGKTTIITQGNQYTFSNHMTRVQMSKHAGDPTFFAIQLQYLQQEGYFLIRCTNHVNQASISSSYLSENVEVLVSPLAEQRRIVAAIEEHFTRLDAGVAALRRAQTTLKRYRAAVLKAAVEGTLTEAWRAEHPDTEPASDLLTRILAERRVRWEADLRAKGKDPAKTRYVEPAAPDVASLPTLPQGWVWATVEQLAAAEPNSITDGPFGSNLKTEHYTETGRRVIRLQNIGDGVFRDEMAFIAPDHFERLAKHQVYEGEIVVAALGDNPPRSCIIPDFVGPAIVKADCIRFKVSPHAISSFVNVALNAEPTRKRTAVQLHGIGRPRLNLSEIKSIVVALPPLAEQEAIVAEVERRLSVVGELEAAVAANLKRAERLRQAILRDAFAGRLVPQDPNDEPASALLERIRGEREERMSGRANGARGNERNGRNGHGRRAHPNGETGAREGRQAGDEGQGRLWGE